MTEVASNSMFRGVWPVMLTPFDAQGAIDYTSLEKLVEWYIAAGVDGLFAVCQSSEMFALNNTESIALARAVIRASQGRVPVIASGHTADEPELQRQQLVAMAETGVDAVVLITNRLAGEADSDEAALTRLRWLVDSLPADVPLGLYECPYPYKRLLSEEILRWCAESGRFHFLKDTCCDESIIASRLKILRGSGLQLLNANSATLLASLQLGGDGFCGVMANFHPQLYVQLCREWKQHKERSKTLGDFLTTASLIEHLYYPACAKHHQYKLGNFSSTTCRVIDDSAMKEDANQKILQQLDDLGQTFVTDN